MATNQLRVLVLFGTRPELIKLAPVVKNLQTLEHVETRVVSTSQHRETTDGLASLFSVDIDFDLDIIRPEQTLVDISQRTLRGLDPILGRLRPNLMLIQGDTCSAFVGALAASYNKVAVGHVEAGLRSFDKLHPYPEEINRRLITTLADLHFAPLESNQRNLLAEGVDADRIFVTGNTVIDALREIQSRDGSASERNLASHIPPEALEGRRLILVTAHRRESFDGHLAELCHALLELVSSYPDLVIAYPVHPNPNVQRTVRPLLENHDRVFLLDPLPYEVFVEAMSRSHLIITDSGGVQEEAPAMGKPVLVFRKVTERVEGVAAHGAKVVGRDRRSLVSEAARLLDDDHAYRQMSASGSLYGDGQASRRIVEAIQHHFGEGDRPEPFVAPALQHATT